MLNKREGLLFLAVLLPETLLIFFLIATRRMVAGHDTLQYFGIQYYFLNHAATHGEIPLWAPFLVQGSPAAWWYLIQAAPLSAFLLQTGNLLKGMDFLPIFYLGIWIDTLFLLVGTWLLAKRFFPSPWTVAFVTATVGGSAIWTSQPWFNFHLFSAYPLCLYLLHRFLDSGRWRYFLAASNLLVIQMGGNLPYFIPVFTFFIFLYFLFYALINRAEILASLRGIRLGLPFVVSAAAITLSFIIFYATLRFTTQETSSYNIGRHPDGTLSLPAFLAYGSNTDPGKWLELLLGASGALDYTLYVGVLTVALLLVGFPSLTRRRLPWVATAFCSFQFSQGVFVAWLAYHLWPTMKFFRHVGLTTCFLKFFLCFLAGLGLELLLAGRQEKVLVKRVRSFGFSFVLLAFLGLSASLFILAHQEAACRDLLKSVLTDGCYENKFFPLFEEGRLGSRLMASAWIALGASGLLLALRLKVSRGLRLPLVGFALALQFVDLYGYKFSDAVFKTAVLTDKQGELTRFRPIPFVRKRDGPAQVKSERAIHYAEVFRFGYPMGLINLYLFRDEPGSSLRIDYCERPLDVLMKAFTKQPLHNPLAKPVGFDPGLKLQFPSEHPAAVKAAAIVEEKVQFFSRAHLFSSEEEAAGRMTDPGYSGDLLFILPQPGAEKPPSAVLWKTGLSLSTNERLGLPYRVERFDSNHLEVAVEVPERESAWMFYSDVWHPFWKASVNGKRVPVARANLAYKAVPLEAGENRVHFVFECRALTWAYRLWGINALLWVVGMLVLSGRIIGAGSPSSKEARS